MFKILGCREDIDKLDPIGQSITDLLNPENEDKIVAEGDIKYQN